MESPSHENNYRRSSSGSGSGCHSCVESSLSPSVSEQTQPKQEIDFSSSPLSKRPRLDKQQQQQQQQQQQVSTSTISSKQIATDTVKVTVGGDDDSSSHRCHSKSMRDNSNNKDDDGSDVAIAVTTTTNNNDTTAAAAAAVPTTSTVSILPSVPTNRSVENDDNLAELETIDHDLALVEEGLTQQRGILFDTSLEDNTQNSQQSGRAVFDSLGSALGSIRSRLHGIMASAAGGRDASADSTFTAAAPTTISAVAAPAASASVRPRNATDTWTALSQRLCTAERAHSTRMPLNLLQQQQQQEREADESDQSRRSASRSASSQPSPPQSMTRSTSSGGGSHSSSSGVASASYCGSDDGYGSGDAAVQNKRRRSSTLMASRRHAESQERQDLELHEGTATSPDNTNGLPKSIPEETTQEINSNDSEQLVTEEEVELLLPESTREQLHKASRNNLTGSLRVLSYGTTKSSLETEKVDTAINTEEGVVVVPTIPPKDTQSYPPLYTWGSLTFQSSIANSKPGVYQIFGNASSDDNIMNNNNEEEEASALLETPQQLPPETRLGRSDIASMSVSATHLAFSTSSGRVLICGDNRAGAVDPSQKMNLSIPRPMHLELLAMYRILKVSCGADHTAALTETDSVLTWGSNQYGQLGHRMHPTTTFVRPAAFAFTGRGTDVACGDGFTMVLTTRMEVYFSGREEITGYNALEERDEAVNGPLIRLPEQNTALQGLPLVHMAAGNKHAVVVTAHGTAYALGCNEFGQCGRMFPKQLHVPVPIAVPKTTDKRCGESTIVVSRSLPNWDVWKAGEPLSLAEDVNIVHAACGKDHTVLLAKNGTLLVCGSNQRGQLGISTGDESSSVTAVQTVAHPIAGRKFVSAETGLYHTVVLDDHGSVWQMGNGKSVIQQITFHPTKCSIKGVAAGGSLSLAIGEKDSDFPNTQNQERLRTLGLNDLVEAIQTNQEFVISRNGLLANYSPEDELARRTEELFRSPAVMNSLFMDPKEIDGFYNKLIECGHAQDVKQKVVAAMEKGMSQGLKSLRDARLIYPEAVRILLLLLQCPLFRYDTDQEDNTSLQFDVHGDVLVLLCETMLGLPFEGYKALMAWTSTLYGKVLFVSFLVKPLVFQLNKRLEKQRTYGVPMIAGVLRWLHNVAEQSDSDLAQSEDFHCVGIDELPMETLFEDLARFRMSTKADRSVNFYLAGNAFLMSPTVKRNLLQVEHQLQMVQAAQTGGVSFDFRTREFTFKPYFVLAIDRKYILQQTLQAVANASPRELKKSLKVVFKGEDGVDAGGITKEFFQLLIQKLFDINTGMWRVENKHEYWFNSDCTWNDDGFYLVGVLVGLAFYNGVLLDVHFPHAVYRKLLGFPLGLEDVVDDDVRKGLKSLLEHDDDDVEDIFCLNFEATWTVLGEQRKKELKPDGSNVPVTNSNKEEYVMLYVKWLLVDSIETQYAEFERGFMQVMEGSSLDLLRPKELELLVVGTPDLDFTALEETAKYEGGFDRNDPVINNLWHWVQSASRETQLKFLKFCTGSNKAPIGGLGKLPFLVQRAGPDSMQLPTAHTCFNTLILPDYGENYDKLSQLLGRAVLECEGFGLQ
ncbi:HECT-domain ubiquitin-transferase [Nitzschia inconspicua]|uniref:HECT-domain ubiquitin-transferase n=1 Tax=Nitzschia inconspicua TaxID=303405 RepID=A0A9K3LYS2_9STRA|nr:HECT-domain ubiquitin-transferase [Nitzschia inconspicua]